MRQKKATWAMLGVSVALVGALIAFGCERSAPKEAEHEHVMEPEPRHGEPAEEHGEHMEEPAHEEAAGEHHEAMEDAGHAEAAHERGHEAVAEEETDNAEPSGKVVDGVRVVAVTARQFEFDPSTIVVRQGEKVRLEVTSEDVTHGIGIEAYDIDQLLPPGETKEIEFTADKTGTHHFHCSIYCGKGHNEMHGELIVLERRD